MSIFNICDIYIPSFVFGNILITDHPYYLSLKNHDKTIFNNYRKHVSNRQRNKDSGKWKGFKKLKHKLKKGFNYSLNKIKLSNKTGNTICRGTGGRHRLCIMAYLNINYKVEIDKDNYICKFI